jgi:hypothetical protein
MPRPFNFILSTNSKNSNSLKQRNREKNQKNNNFSLHKNSQNLKFGQIQPKLSKIETRRVCFLIDCLIGVLPIPCSIKTWVKRLKGQKKIKTWQLLLNKKLKKGGEQYENRKPNT